MKKLKDNNKQHIAGLPRRLTSLKRVRGIAIIEVLISMLILGIAVQGILSTWDRVVQENEHSYSRSQARLIAQNVIEMVRSNPDGWNIYSNPVSWEGALPNGFQNNCNVTTFNPGQACLPGDFAQQDIDSIRFHANAVIPAFNGDVKLFAPCQGAGAPRMSCVVVAWGNTLVDQCNPLADASGALVFDGDADNPRFDEQDPDQCLVVDFLS